MNNPSPQTTHNAFLHNPSPHTLHRLLSMFFQIQIPSLLDQHVQRKLAERLVMTMMMATPTKRVMMQMWVRQQTTNSQQVAKSNNMFHFIFITFKLNTTKCLKTNIKVYKTIYNYFSLYISTNCLYLICIHSWPRKVPL